MSVMLVKLYNFKTSSTWMEMMPLATCSSCESLYQSPSPVCDQISRHQSHNSHDISLLFNFKFEFPSNVGKYNGGTTVRDMF